MNPAKSAARFCRAQFVSLAGGNRRRFRNVVGAGLALLALNLRAQPADLEVGVRAKVQDGRPVFPKGATEADGGHSMIYGILAIKQVDNVDHLVGPVNEKRVVSLLMDTLDANGFREFVRGEKPGILITASYGRGEMSNPYIRDTGEVGGVQSQPSPGSRPPMALDSQPAQTGPVTGLSSNPMTLESSAPAQNITGASPLQLFDEKSHGYEAKLQKASYEKLFIRITAWSYPEGPKAHPKMLWKTIMVVDDPDHRDLNQVAEAMLGAGGPFFDKNIRNPEVEVHKPLPDGHVNVGTPQVREPFKPPVEK